MRLLAFLFLLFPFILHAQQKEGIIYFEEKMNMHRAIPSEDAQLKAMIPEWRILQSELLFNETESLYRNIEEEEEEEEAPAQGINIKMQRPEALFYRNFSSMHKTDMREFFGKTYLIDEALSGGNWKMSTETKQILGYNCMKAMTTDTVRKREIVAWYTPDLPLPSGPTSYGELPGTILEIDMNNGEVLLVAKKVEFKKIKKGEIKAPTKGEKTTEAEFNKIMAERMRETGGRPIRVIRN